jgi:hypothetical protein
MASNCWNGIRPGRTVARDGSAHDDGHVCRFSAATDDAIRRPSVTGLWLSFRRTGPHWTVASLRTLSGAAHIIARFAGFRAFLVGFTNQAQYGLFNVAEPFLMVRHLQVFVGGMYVHTRCVNIVGMGLLFDLPDGGCSQNAERGTMVAGVGYTPNYHDVLTGSQPDGRAYRPQGTAIRNKVSF